MRFVAQNADAQVVTNNFSIATNFHPSLITPAALATETKRRPLVPPCCLDSVEHEHTGGESGMEPLPTSLLCSEAPQPPDIKAESLRHTLFTWSTGTRIHTHTHTHTGYGDRRAFPIC